MLQAAGQGGSQKQGLSPPICKCGEPAAERVSWTTKNPERKFYKCSQPQVSLASGVSACSAAEVMCFCTKACTAGQPEAALSGALRRCWFTGQDGTQSGAVSASRLPGGHS